MHETNSKHRKSKLPTFLACLSQPCGRLQSQYLRQIPTTGFVRRFQGATFSRENIPLKTFTQMFFDLLLWQKNHNAITVKKTAIIFFTSTGIFASEPMTLREIDHVSFLVGHVQTFFAGEARQSRGPVRMLLINKGVSPLVRIPAVTVAFSLLSVIRKQ